jgi:hypothetical protein
MITLSVPEPEMETIQALAELPQEIPANEMINTHVGTSFDTKIILPASQRDVTVIVPPTMEEGQYWIRIHPKLVKAHQGLEIKTTDYVHDSQDAITITIVMRNTTSEPIELYAGSTLIEIEMKNTNAEDEEEEAKVRKKLMTPTLCSELSINETIAHVVCEITNNINLSEDEKEMAIKLITDKK